MDTLERMLAARSVAIIGASDNPARIGGRPLDFLRRSGFSGRILPVNPGRRHVQNLAAYSSVGEIGEPIDLAVIAVPAPLVADAVADCIAARVPGCIVFSAGFAEAGTDGARGQERIVAMAREAGMRLLGPNCLGAINVHSGLHATFSGVIDLVAPRPGGLSIVSQSGALGSHLFFLAARAGIGQRYLVTTGNECDLQVADGIATCARDPETELILAYSEGFGDGDRLVRALEAASTARKPVIFMKVGSSPVGALAAGSHTASLTGEDAVADAVLRQYGAHRATSLEEMIDVAYAALAGRRPAGSRLGIITVSGGAGILMADEAERRGLDVPPMPETAQQSLRSILPFAAVRNPVDVTAQVLNQMDLFPRFLEVLLDKGGFDAVAAFFSTTTANPRLFESFMRALGDLRRTHPDAAVILSLIAGERDRAALEELGYPVMADPNRAVAALAALARMGERLSRPPAGIAEPLDLPVPAHGGPLSEIEARDLVAAAGIPVVPAVLVRSAEDAAAAAGSGRMVLKIVSSAVQHKTEIGGVLLNLEGADAVSAGYETLVARFRRAIPDREPDGVLVSPMLEDAVELIVGTTCDPVFGPVVMAGIGGVFVEVLRDVSFRKAPFDVAEAHCMLRELRGSAILDGVRGGRPRDREAAAQALSLLSRLAAGTADRIASIEINPLMVLAQGKGCVAVDALIVPQVS